MSDEKPCWIMHIDMDAFFASVEQRDHPEYRNKPLIVGARPDGRGVVSTCSYEARQFGVCSAMPISEAYRRCPDGIYVQPDMQSYSVASKAVMSALTAISPVVEQVSVDEAYVDLTGLERLFGTPREIGERVKRAVREQTDLSCSVGIGPNRLIAKLASEYEKPNGLTIVDTSTVQAFLDPMPVSNLRGVGKVSLRTLTRLGIRQVYQLRQCSLEYLAQSFGEKGAANLYRQARGKGSVAVGQTGGRKSLSKERTFGQDEADLDTVKAKMRGLVAEVGRSLRREQLKGGIVTVKLRYGNFETYTRQCRLPEYTDQDQIIYESAVQLMEKIETKGHAIRLVGVGLSDWGSNQQHTTDLFTDKEADQKSQRLTETMDRINDRFGNSKLLHGISVVGKTKDKK